MIPVLRSLADPQVLRDVVAETYRITVVDCVLIRSFVNDVYRVTATDGDYALKLYRHDRWRLSELKWEQELVASLYGTGVPVPQVVPTKTGEHIGKVQAPEGVRGFALTEYVSGSKPSVHIDGELYRRFGDLVGRFHQRASEFHTDLPRRPASLERTLAKPLADLTAILTGDDVTMIVELADRAHAQIVSASGLRWGVRHGDVTLDNIHDTGINLVLHDFDSASPGLLAADLVGVAATRFWDDFVAGYCRQTELTDLEIAMLPWFDVVRRIGNLRFHLVDKPAWSGIESLSEGWAEGELIGLREAADRLL